MPCLARRFSASFAPLPRLALMAVIFSSLTVGADAARAIPPRSERVINRAAERAYARMSIAEARAARAEARVADIAPIVPVPPPPRPATVRRMRRAGVPLAAQPPIVVAPSLAPVHAAPLGQVVSSTIVETSPVPVVTGPAASPPPAFAAPPASASIADPVPARAALPPRPAPPAADGTQSVLASAEESVAEARASGVAGPVDVDPPIELLPTPQPE